MAYFCVGELRGAPKTCSSFLSELMLSLHIPVRGGGGGGRSRAAGKSDEYTVTRLMLLLLLHVLFIDCLVNIGRCDPYRVLYVIIRYQLIIRASNQQRMTKFKL